MGAVKVLYTDIDGTLVGPLGNLFWTGDRRLTLEPARAIVAAHEAGLELVPLSGRSRMLMIEVARLIGAETWLGELGAIRSYERGREVIVDTGGYQGGALVDDLWKAARGLAERFPGRLEEHTPWNVGRETSLLLRGSVDVVEAEAWLAEQGMPWATFVDNGVIPRHYDTLPGIDRPRAYHLVPVGISKVAAVAADRAHRGFAAEECAVIGDALSDLECSSEVGRTFIVSNAMDKDPHLAELVEAQAGIEVTGRDHGEGFADVVFSLIS